MGNGLYVTPEKFLSFSELSENKTGYLQDELYATGWASGFDPLSWFGLLPDPDPILRKMGEGVEILRSLLGDDKVISSIQNRKLGTLKKFGCGYKPGKIDEEPDKESQQLCDMLSEDIKNIKLYDVFSQVLDAPYYGFSTVEIVWHQANGFLRIKALKPRPQEWFGYNSDRELVFTGLEGLRDIVPAFKTVTATHFPDPVNPYGLRLLSRCLWPVAIKKGGIQFWATLAERFGMPWVIGKVPGQKKDRDEALSSLAQMVQNAVAVISQGSEVDVHTFSGGGDLHPALIKYCDRCIARALQGQNQANEGESTGSYAESQTGRESLVEDYQEADENLLVTFMNDLAKIYRDVNKSKALAPTFYFSEEKDLAVQADLDKKLTDMGVKFKKSHFERKYQLSSDEFDIAESEGKDSTKTDLSDGSEETEIDILANGLLDKTSPLQKNEELVLDAVLSSESFEEALEKLLNLYPDMDVSKLEEQLFNGSFNSMLHGFYTAQREAEDDNS